MRGYYCITDDALSRNGNERDVRDAVDAGVTVVQYRSKNADSRMMYEEALILRRICFDAGVTFIVNDRIDIALAVDADGVHIGSLDIPYEAARRVLGNGRIIGVSVQTAEEARMYGNLGADYLGAGPVFPTGTKADAAPPIGLAGLRAIAAAVTIPVAAIGGITPENARETAGAGADALCAISAVVASDDVKGMIKLFQEIYT